jgi:hypothetical protein
MAPSTDDVEFQIRAKMTGSVAQVSPSDPKPR